MYSRDADKIIYLIAVSKRGTGLVIFNGIVRHLSFDDALFVPTFNSLRTYAICTEAVQLDDRSKMDDHSAHVFIVDLFTRK